VEWATARAAYGGEVGEGVQVVHISGPGLAELYAEADLFSMVFEPNSYRAVTVPVKLFECLGYATPVVTMVGAGGPAQTETARLIAEYGLGWVVGSVEELRALLERLRDDPAPIAAQRAHLAELRPRHTWAARAQYVADTLTGSRAPELRSS
jgi:hypothetical protein